MGRMFWTVDPADPPKLARYKRFDNLFALGLLLAGPAAMGFMLGRVPADRLANVAWALIAIFPVALILGVLLREHIKIDEDGALANPWGQLAALASVAVFLVAFIGASFLR